MGLLQGLLGRAAVARNARRRNSRFGGFNSRLAANKFPASGRRELSSKDLNCLAIFGARTALFGNNRQNSRFHGNNREFCDRAKWRVEQPAVAAICGATQPTIPSGVNQ